MRGLTGNILRTFSTQVPSLIISIVSGIFLTRLLGAEGKGVYAIFYANIEIMVMIFVMGCDIGIVYYGSNKKISIGKLQGIAIYILLISIPLTALIVFFIKTSLFFPDGYSSLFFKLFLLGMFALHLLNTLIGAFIKTTKSFKYINRISLINSVFNVSTYSVLFYLNSKGFIEIDLNFIFTTSIVILFLNTLMWMFSFYKNMPLEPIFNISIKEDLYPFYKYIFPVFISLIINFLNYRLDIWLVSYYDGNIQLGIYVLAVNFAQFILFYSRIIGGVMMPYLSENDDVQRRKYFSIYSRISFTSLILIISGLAIVGGWLLGFIYGEEFVSSGAPFNILLIGMLFTGMSQLFSIMLFSKGKNNVALFANSVGLFSTVLFDVLLIPRYGIMGAALATSISYCLLFLVLLYYLVKKEKLTFSEIFIVRKDDFAQLFQKD